MQHNSPFFSLRTVFELVAPRLQAEDIPAARLTCCDLAAAVDANSSTVIRHIVVREWDTAPWATPRTLQHSITSLEAHITSTNDWQQLLHFTAQLPQLHALSVTGRRLWPPHLTSSSHLSSTTPHQHLQAVRFEGHLTSLQELSLLTPHLEHLSCNSLVLHAPGPNSHTAGCSLPRCKLLSAASVTNHAYDEQDAAEAFAAALPQLNFLTDTPTFFQALPGPHKAAVSLLPIKHALRCCRALEAIRTFGSSTALGGLVSQQLQDLQALTCLSVYGVGPVVELLGISSLTQLSALSLTFELPNKRAAQLLQQVCSLPRLQQLALPAKLLCSSCCMDMGLCLEQCLRQRLSQQCSAPTHRLGSGTGIDSSGSSSSSKDVSANRCKPLQQLLFLVRPRSLDSRRQRGDYCKHCQEDDFQELAGQLAAKSGGHWHACMPMLDAAGSPARHMGAAAPHQPALTACVEMPLAEQQQQQQQDIDGDSSDVLHVSSVVLTPKSCDFVKRCVQADGGVHAGSPVCMSPLWFE